MKTAHELMDFAKRMASAVTYAYETWRDKVAESNAPPRYTDLTMTEAEIAAGMYFAGMRRAAELVEIKGYILASDAIRKEIGDV